MWYRNRFIGVFRRGQKRERCSATILQQLTKEDTEQTCRENNTGKNYSIQKLKQFLLNGQAPHTRTK